MFRPPATCGIAARFRATRFTDLTKERLSARSISSGPSGSPAGVARSLLWVLLLWSPLLAQQAAAQQPAGEETYTLIVRDVPLSEALERLVEMTRVSLLYGPELDRSVRVFCAARDQTPEQLLRCVVHGAGKDYYRLSSGTYVIIEPAQGPPRLGALSGIIVDAETDEPLPFASVLLAESGTGTAASENGLFAMSGLLPGRYRLIASYIGYRAEATEVEVLPDGTARRRIALTPEPIAARPVIVDGLQQRATSEGLGLTEMAEAELERAPGASGPLGATRTGLGLTVRPLTNSVHIQGGEAGEHQLQIDGTPVFSPLSVGKLFGSFSPLAIDRVTVHKAGFGAPQGSFTAGVVQLDHSLSDEEQATVLADPNAVNMRIAQRFPIAGRDVSAMVAGRYGLWDVWRVPSVDRLLRDWNEFDPVLMATLTATNPEGLEFVPHRHGSDLGFSDWHAAARVQLSPFTSVSTSGYHGASSVSTEQFATGHVSDVADPVRVSLSRDRYEWTNTSAQIRMSSLFGARALGSARLRVSNHSLTQAYAMADSLGIPSGADVGAVERALSQDLDTQERLAAGNVNRMTEVGADARIDLSLGPGHLLELGVEAARVDHRFDLGGPVYLPIRSEASSLRFAGFAQDRRALSPNLTLESGFRLTFVPDRQSVYAEPRAALRFDGENDVLGQHALRVAGGLYRQFVNQFDLTNVGPSAIVSSVRFWLPVDRSLEPPLAVHASVEALASPLPGWDIRAEGYYKHLPRLLALDYGALFDHDAVSGEEPIDQAAYIGAARGFSYGGGVRVERTSERLRLRAGYDVSVSRRTFPSLFDGQTQPTPWDEPHRVLVGADVDAFGGIVVRGRARAVWGRTWGFRQPYYDVLAVHDSPFSEEVGLPEDARLPALYELDLGLSYARQVAATRFEITADFLNVLDRGNVIDYGLRVSGEPGPTSSLESEPRRMLGFHPLVSIRISM